MVIRPVVRAGRPVIFIVRVTIPADHRQSVVQRFRRQSKADVEARLIRVGDMGGIQHVRARSRWHVFVSHFFISRLVKEDNVVPRHVNRSVIGVPAGNIDRLIGNV